MCEGNSVVCIDTLVFHPEGVNSSGMFRSIMRKKSGQQVFYYFICVWPSTCLAHMIDSLS